LQGELMALVAGVVDGPFGANAEPATRGTRRGHKSIEQIAAEHLERVKRPITKGGRSVDLIRAERDAR
jgi:hypothetical protein